MYAFPIVAVVSSIPVFSIVVKYNLIENGASPRLAFLWGVVAPWVMAFPLVYMPDILGQVHVHARCTCRGIPGARACACQVHVHAPIDSRPGCRCGQFINFSSLLFVGFTDFIVPFSLFIVLQRQPRLPAPTTSTAGGLANVPFGSSPPLLSVQHGPRDDLQTIDSLPPPDSVYLNNASGPPPRPHHTFPCDSYAPPAYAAGKSLLAALLGTVLTVLALVATYLTVRQGSYTFDQRTCALVGN